MFFGPTADVSGADASDVLDDSMPFFECWFLFDFPLQAIARERERPPRRTPSPEVPPEVQAELIGQFLEQHYAGWLDTPLPALDGRTPREAAALKSARPKLISLLKHMESSSDRDRRAGKPAYDFGWMWAELGLARPQ